MTQSPEHKSFIEPPEYRYPFVGVILPWIILLVVCTGFAWLAFRTQISCTYRGELITPAALAARSTEGIGLDETATVKKTAPLAKTTTPPLYGPAK